MLGIRDYGELILPRQRQGGVHIKLLPSDVAEAWHGPELRGLKVGELETSRHSMSSISKNSTIKHRQSYGTLYNMGTMAYKQDQRYAASV